MVEPVDAAAALDLLARDVQARLLLEGSGESTVHYLLLRADSGSLSAMLRLLHSALEPLDQADSVSRIVADPAVVNTLDRQCVQVVPPLAAFPLHEDKICCL